MTDELLAQIIKKNEMYVDWKTTPITPPNYEKVKLNFKGYKNCFEWDRMGKKGIF